MPEGAFDVTLVLDCADTRMFPGGEPPSADDAGTVLVIDHHRTAMIELHDISNTHFDMNHSGARLSWDFFHPGHPPPKLISYIEDRDLWKWELPYSKEFSAAFDMVPFTFEDFEKFEDDSVFDDAVKRGSYILAYSKTVVKKICEKASRRRLAGLTASS